MLSKALAKDWGKFGIRVNSIGPGYFITEMNKKSYENPEKRELRENKTMLGKWGKMDQLIGPILFLSSNASSYVTGQDIYIDGGWTANGLLPE
jgi:NAD(P)-dependent dehydrogenase (short-subunit alcohol dehydrogenase family)